jgi:hypothetical protein
LHSLVRILILERAGHLKVGLRLVSSLVSTVGDGDVLAVELLLELRDALHQGSSWQDDLVLILRDLGLLGCSLVRSVEPLKSVVGHRHIVLLDQVLWVGILPEGFKLPALGLLLDTSMLDVLVLLALLSFASDVVVFVHVEALVGRLLVLDIHVLLLVHQKHGAARDAVLHDVVRQVVLSPHLLLLDALARRRGLGLVQDAGVATSLVLETSLVLSQVVELRELGRSQVVLLLARLQAWHPHLVEVLVLARAFLVSALHLHGAIHYLAPAPHVLAGLRRVGLHELLAHVVVLLLAWHLVTHVVLCSAKFVQRVLERLHAGVHALVETCGLVPLRGLGGQLPVLTLMVHEVLLHVHLVRIVLGLI